MPLYSYKCNRCKKVDDHFRRMSDRRIPSVCECGGIMLRAITEELSNPHVFKPYWEEHLADDDHPNGVYLHSHRQHKQLMREMGFEHKSGAPHRNLEEV
jgi:putative FmdB family regulatory protein